MPDSDVAAIRNDALALCTGFKRVLSLCEVHHGVTTSDDVQLPAAFLISTFTRLGLLDSAQSITWPPSNACKWFGLWDEKLVLMLNSRVHPGSRLSGIAPDQDPDSESNERQ